ncbi:MAG: hypothetical protein K6E30_10665 [Lachnospiraceae bacterium]|nr:hypothetical protein [Lachnospiraceae bacterium]
MKIYKSLCIAAAFLLMAAGCAQQKDVPENSSSPEASFESSAETALSGDENEKISDETALLAIENYCRKMNPDLTEGEDAGKNAVSWEIESSGEEEIVVLYHSYTSALVRYYIDRVSGETYVTEFVSGITPEEERTDESFNVRDYIPAEEG